MGYDWEEIQELAEEFPGYGSSRHYPYCNQGNCTGCIPVFDVKEPPQAKLDLSIFRKDN